MPVYRLNNETYNIPDDVVSDFEKDNPSASISYMDGSDEYEIPLNKRDGFIKAFPTAKLKSYDVISTPQPTKEEIQQYTLSHTPFFHKDERSLLDKPIGHFSDESEREQNRIDYVNDAYNKPEYIDSFIPAFKQGSDALYQGVKSAVGESANLIGGSHRDYAKAKEQLDELIESGYNLKDFDAEKALNDYKERAYQKELSGWNNLMTRRRAERENMGFFDAIVHKFKDPSRPYNPYDQSASAFASRKMGDEVQLSRAYLAIQDALEKSKGNVDKAYEILGTQHSKETWGDQISKEARKTMREYKPTKGFAAWTGGMIPQMIGNAAALAASVSPYTRWLSKPLGVANMGLLTASTAGSSMATARDYSEQTGKNISEGDILRSGGIDASIELGTEMIPYSRYFSKVQNFTKKAIGNTIAGSFVSNSATKRELGNLLERANKELGGRLFSGKNVKEYLKDVGYEGMSEFLAESLETLTPMIYQSPEDYPTLNEVLQNGWEGAKGGLFMGAFLGAGSRITNHYANRERRKGQGSVILADTNKGVVEIIGEKDSGYSAITSEGDLIDIPSSEVRDMGTVSFNEFDRGVANKVKDDAENGLDVSQVTPEDKLEHDIAVEMQTILDCSDPSTGILTECNRIITNDIGEQELVPGHIVGHIGDAPVWQAIGSNERITLKEGEYDPASIQSMSTKDMIDATSEMMREEAQKKAEMESKYDLSRINPPSGGTTFTDISGRQITIIDKNPNGGWIAKAPVLDEKGNPKKDDAGNVLEETFSITDEDYYDTMQAQLNAKEEQSILQQKYGTKVLDDGRTAVITSEKNGEISYDIIGFRGNLEDSGNMSLQEYESLQDYAPVEEEELNDDGLPVNSQQAESSNLSQNKVESEVLPSVRESIMTSNEKPDAIGEVNPSTESIQEQKPVLPVDEQGNILYHKMPMEDTIADLTDGTLDDNEIDGFIAANKADAGKLLKKVSKSSPKISTNKAQYLVDKKAWQEKVADAQARVDYWNSIDEEIAASRVQPGDKTAEAILSMGEPMNGEELAAMMLGTGRLPVLYDSYKKETGGGNAEARGMVGLFASKANGGMTVEEAGEQLILADQENGTNFFDANDPNAGRNAIIDVLSGARTRGDLFSFIQRNREAIAERERQAELEAYEQTIAKLAESSHMTPEEFIAFEENIAQMLEERLKDVSDEELKSIFAEPYLDENERIRESNEVGTGVPQREERAGSNEGSPGVFGEERSDNAGASGRNEERPESDDEIGHPSDGVLPETNAVEGRTEVAPIGVGPFGNIYTQFKGKAKEAIAFLLGKKSGEAIGALHHPDIGDIDLVWGRVGTGKSNGFGLSKLAEYHPEVLDNLQDLLDEMKITTRSENRINLESDTHKAAIRLEWDGVRKNWLLTAFEKEAPTPIDKTTDTGENQSDLQSDTALLQDVGTSSENKDSELSDNKQENGKFVAPEQIEGESILDYASRINESKRVHDAGKEVDTNPTEAQKEAGNYKKGHIKIDGFDISIENPKGSVRSGVDAEGKPWNVTMNNSYGYIRGTEGVDGDHIDVFLGNGGSNVYVVDQVNQDSSFDEHKVMYGFNSEEEARGAYLANYSPGWQGLGAISEVSKDNFKKWIDSSHRKTKPFVEYKIAQTNQENSDNVSIRFREVQDAISSFASKYNLEETDVRKYAESMQNRNLGGASYAFQEIRRKLRLDNTNDNLMQFSKRIAPIIERLYEAFGNIDELRDEVVRATMEERNVMEAARKRAEEEAAVQKKRLEEFELMTDEEMDASYFKALEVKDESRMRDIINEVARRKGYVSADEFRMAHRAPSYDEEGIDKSLIDVANNKDSIRESLNEQLRMNRDRYRDESASAINEALLSIDRGEKPTVTIYRAVPKSLKEGKIRNGDWVSFSESYVKVHGEHTLNGEYKIITEEVPADNLYWDGNDINEWGYDDRSDYRYKDIKNNRKLNDLITRDDKGNIVPPSKRFNSRKKDVRFRNAEDIRDTIAEQGKIVSEVKALSDSLHTPVRAVKSVEELSENDSARKRIEKGGNVKGWFDIASGEVVVYLPNAVSVGDAKETILHEIVGHYGLQKMFGKDFDAFLDNVYTNASTEVRKGIIDRANKRGNILDLREATEEYLAELAERGFENEEEKNLWQKIKDAFIDMLRKAGVRLGFDLTDNELRYILWKSYQNLESPSIIEQAADVDMQNRLGVGEYRARENDIERENYERALNVVNEFAEKHVGAGDVFVIRSKEMLRAQLKEKNVAPEDIAKYERWMEEGNIPAFFAPKYGRIVVLDSNLSKEELNAYLWHESTHKVLHELDDREKVIDVISAFVKDNVQNTYKEVVSLYEKDGENHIKEECVTFFIEDLINYGKEDKMSSGNVHLKNKEINDVICRILNRINHGTENEESENGFGNIRGERAGYNRGNRSSSKEVRDHDGNGGFGEGSKSSWDELRRLHQDEAEGVSGENRIEWNKVVKNESHDGKVSKPVSQGEHGKMPEENSRIEEVTSERRRRGEENMRNAQGNSEALPEREQKGIESGSDKRFRTGESTGEERRAPGKVEAYYKKEIRELNNRISTLEKTIEKYENGEDVSKAVVEEIKRQISSDFISEINKSELNSLLMQVQKAKTKKSLEKVFMNVKRIALDVHGRKLQRVIDKLLALKVQDVNGKNMSIAKNVDDSTRKIFAFIRGNLSDLKVSGLEDAILSLKRENRSHQEEVKRLERTVRDSSDIQEKDSVMNSIKELQNTINENKRRINELRDEVNEIKENIANSKDIDIDKEIELLNDKIERAARNEDTWTQGDNERLAALNIISATVTNKKHEYEIRDIELQMQKLTLNNSDMRHERIGVEDETERKKIDEKIKENHRQIVALERLINDTRSMQVQQMQMTIEQLNELISNGKNSLLRRTEEEVKRRSYLIGNAIRSVEGKPIDINDKSDNKEGTLKKFFSAPLGSFEYMCQRVNTKTFGKDGFLYKKFIQGEDGTMKAYDAYILGMKELRNRLDEKSMSIFGKNFEKITSLSDKVINESGVHVFDPNKGNGYGVAFELPLSKGQAMYIYMVWKMNDGRTKLELQGFNEKSIAEIKSFIGDAYIKFADWAQEELLPELREKYNEKYIEIYGTSMADIPNYVPLKINKKAIQQESSLSDDGKKRKTLEEKAGSLINRVVNTKPVDISENGFSVLFQHGKQMEEWNAYARVRKDLDAVLSSTTFRNQLNANVRGSYDNLYDAAEVATKVNHPDNAKFGDAVMGKLSKGLVGGNITFRLYTALKQVLSAPAFFGYSQSPIYMGHLAKNVVNLYGNFKWCMENMPSFYERVTAGTARNEKLDEKSFAKWMDKYIEIGMVPNKMIDAITCSIGAKSIYDYKHSQLKKSGLNEKKAHNQALMEADIYYNQTQQSSHPVFLSPMQTSRTFADRMLTTYQNSNIGYVRKVLANFYDLTRSLKWKELKRNYTEMYIQEGLSEQEAESKAYRRLLNENKKHVVEFALFGWGLNALWNIGSQGLLGFLRGDGDDDDKWTKDIAFLLTSPTKGVPGGNLLESIASGYGMNPFLVYDELGKFMKEAKYAVDEYGLISPEIAYITLMKASRYSGVDLETWGNIYLGIEGMARSEAVVDDKMIDLMFILNAPKSNRATVAKELYKDESLLDFAEKVARANKYIPKRDAWEGWVPGTKDLTKRRESAIEKEYERLHMTEEQKKEADERKIADKHKRKLKELKDDPLSLAKYIDGHKKEHQLYRKYY